MSGVVIRDAAVRQGERQGERPDVVAALARAAAAIARLDHALTGHPLLPAILYRARLDAVRRAAAADGHAIDPWHLAALLEGLRLRMDPYLTMLDRGAIFDAARHAFDQYQWLVRPDFDEEGEIQAAERLLAAAPGAAPLLAGAHGFYQWIDQGGDRRAGRTALVRFWQRHGLLHAPFPLLGAAALRAGTPWIRAAWLTVFLESLAAEAADGLQCVMTLEHAWFSARTRVAARDGRRSTSRAARAIDVMAAAPLVSATSLGRALGMAPQNAGVLLEGFRGDGIALELSHRARRRLYGLADLAPLRDGVAPPRRPEPGRGRGRPPLVAIEDEVPTGPPPPLPPLTPLERRSLDYSGLEAAMAFVDEAMRNAKRLFATLPQQESVGPVADSDVADDEGDRRALDHNLDDPDTQDVAWP
ncbi:MAG: hypothetical protein JSS43_06895 [Proteobacteria bacterium]|nr:hypothetical protein [Pseudomonadota bacterium]